jgi:rhodanese-related sulfurtransferase
LLGTGTPLKMIDVRTPAEFEAAHIPGSYNVPLDLLPEHRNELRDSLRTPTVLVCRSGGRARQAAQLLREAHLDNVHILDGGLSAWEAENKPLKRGIQRWGLERQVRGVAGALVLLGTLGGMLFWKPLTVLAAFIGGGLAFSAATDSCGMAMLLSKLPYNRAVTCDMRDVIERLATDQA